MRRTVSEASFVASAEAACATRGLGGSAPDQLSIQTICWPTLKGSERTPSPANAPLLFRPSWVTIGATNF